MSWWDFGENTGYSGNSLNLQMITCPFCEHDGNFTTSYHAEKKNHSRDKKLNYDTMLGGNCGNYLMVFWSVSYSGTMHDFITVPWPRKIARFPEHWPNDVGRYGLQEEKFIWRELGCSCTYGKKRCSSFCERIMLLATI